MRTGLTTVGMPGAPQGIQPEDPTLGGSAQAAGLHDRADGQEPPRRQQPVPADGAWLRRVLREPLPPQRRGGAGAARLPNDHPAFQKFFKPAGCLDCKASDVDDPTEDPRFGRVGKQTIKDSGPLTRKRMETIEDDLLARSVDFIERATARRQAVPAVAQHDPDACLDAPVGAVEGQDRLRRLRRRYAGAGLGGRRAARTSSTSWGSPTTRS